MKVGGIRRGKMYFLFWESLTPLEKGERPAAPYWGRFQHHQKRGWYQTGRRSAATLRGIRVRGASLFSRMWEGAAAPLRGGFPNQPHHWENFRSSCTIRRKKIFSRAPGFQRPPRRSLQLCTVHGQPSYYASLELFFVFIKKILLVENDLHVLKKVN